MYVDTVVVMPFTINLPDSVFLFGGRTNLLKKERTILFFQVSALAFVLDVVSRFLLFFSSRQLPQQLSSKPVWSMN